MLFFFFQFVYLEITEIKAMIRNQKQSNKNAIISIIKIRIFTFIFDTLRLAGIC